MFRIKPPREVTVSGIRGLLANNELNSHHDRTNLDVHYTESGPPLTEEKAEAFTQLIEKNVSIATFKLSGDLSNAEQLLELLAHSSQRSYSTSISVNNYLSPSQIKNILVFSNGNRINFKFLSNTSLPIQKRIKDFMGTTRYSVTYEFSPIYTPLLLSTNIGGVYVHWESKRNLNKVYRAAQYMEEAVVGSYIDKPVRSRNTSRVLEMSAIRNVELNMSWFTYFNPRDFVSLNLDGAVTEEVLNFLSFLSPEKLEHLNNLLNAQTFVPNRGISQYSTGFRRMLTRLYHHDNGEELLKLFYQSRNRDNRLSRFLITPRYVSKPLHLLLFNLKGNTGNERPIPLTGLFL